MQDLLFYLLDIMNEYLDLDHCKLKTHPSLDISILLNPLLTPLQLNNLLKKDKQISLFNFYFYLSICPQQLHIWLAWIINHAFLSSKTAFPAVATNLVIEDTDQGINMMPNKCGTRLNIATTNKLPSTDCGNLRITLTSSTKQIVEIIILMMEKSGLKATRQSW